MNEEKINALKDALREIVQLIVQRKGPMPEDLKALLVQTMEHVASRIQQLRAEEQEGVTGGMPPIVNQPEMQEAMPSSNVFGFNYDYPSKKLHVKFQGNDGVGQGPVYAYEGVEPYIFNLFKRGAAIAKTSGKNRWGEWWRGKSPSIGAAVHQFLIAGNYPYQKVS